MKLCAIILAVTVLSMEDASASDTTGALVLIPIAGGLVGLVIGTAGCIMVCSKKRARPAIWLSLPVCGVAGFVLSLVALNFQTPKYQDKVVCSFGRYDQMRGGMGVLTVPHNFTASDLEEFYRLLTNRDNSVLSSHEFAAALVHQGNGIASVRLNVYPGLEVTTKEYTTINDEVRRQMEIVLKRHTQRTDARE